MRSAKRLANSAVDLLRDTVEAFVADDALSRGAAIAYYTIFSIAPVLLVVVAIAGLVFGHDAAQGAIVGQLSGLMGADTAKALQAMIESAGNPAAGTLATILGFAALIVTVTGVFGEIQSALNAIWKVQSHERLISRLLRGRLASLGLVVTLGFLLTVSLAISAALAAFSAWLKVFFPVAEAVLHVADIALSALLIAELSASTPADDFFEAKMTVLTEEIKHHVKEEEKPKEGLFAQVRDSGVDLMALAGRMQARKEALLAQFKREGLPAPTTRSFKGPTLKHGHVIEARS